MISLLARSAIDPLATKLFRALPTAGARFEYLCISFDSHRDGCLLAGIEYTHFLGTTYWRIIRDYLLWKRGGACENCGRGGLMVLHHKTYEHHGFEHKYLNDLLFLCRECHERVHKSLDDHMAKLLHGLADKMHIPREEQIKANPYYGLDPERVLSLHGYLCGKFAFSKVVP